MGDIFTNLKRIFRSGNILVKLIYINVGVFLLFRLAAVLFLLFNVAGLPFLEYLQMPSSPVLLLLRPWTLFTYMFTHYDFLHILFNMLWLYWFGGIFLQFFNERQLGGMYVLGGIAGALLFLVAYNIFPYFQAVAGSSFLMGASASVMAIVFAVSFYRKEYEINLLLIGRVKLIWLALFTLIVDLLAITSTNAGGHLAHIGGALLGIWFASRIQKGKDMTAPVNRLIDWLVNLGKKKPKMKVTYKRTETDQEYNARKQEESKNLDDILDKLKRSGYDSLSKEEKKQLFDASKK
ncbi:rhomboid family intramembrane serine protease [Parabacteroides sp. PF5-6]|uniref:rhomboid family protein n=1 Tax=Parabacteroides sp. PF5-6 TaxID=1742403 RepID=UPI002405E3FC|nr:rhomboid family intramembrane serine protease [Parabacteroides sp. PF5-6]MDF9831292.1 membrane associated rhomboid family serine protease [Parabacteroides sp. PF5-6]